MTVLIDNTLIFNIVYKGIRPEITSPLIPPCIAEINVKCWDANPENRPTAKEVHLELDKLNQIYWRFKEKPKNQKFQISKEFKIESPEIIQFF
ncbi:hypothetical protein G9A89_005071 [Geosiphon pyriformis]|nr:hypothetical protein G9A89_005071 [Geosiphon pyriformis]